MNSVLKKEYTNDEVTIVWKPKSCIHSGVCRKGLPDVFDPNARPWVNTDAATSQELTDQVDKCPSGALSWYKNADGPPKEKEQAAATDTSIDVAPNGPLLIKGNIKVSHSDGKVEHRDSVTALCRCGQSANKPFCDGTHSRVGWTE